MSILWQFFPFSSLLNIEDHTRDEDVPEDGCLAFPILELPDSIITHILSFLSADTLTHQCRSVCQTFRNLIDGHALWKAKCVREGKTVPNYRFERPPPRYYQLICIHNPYAENIIRNPCGKTGTVKEKFAYWDVKRNGGDHWEVERPPKGADPTPTDDGHCFASSYDLCSKVQTIHLRSVGVLPEVMDLIKPPIEVSEWYAARFDCGSTYQMKVDLLDHKRKPLESFSTGIIRTEQWTGHEWKQIKHVFNSYPEGVRFVRFCHSGKDTQFWAGHYGAKMTDACVRILNVPYSSVH